MDKGPAPFGIDQMMLRRPSSLLASRLQPSIIALHQRSITTVNAQNFMKASMNTVMGQRRLLSSAAHDHTEDLKHFEVHSPQDAVPFGTNNRFWWAFKLTLVSAVGFGAPVFIVYWQM